MSEWLLFNANIQVKNILEKLLYNKTVIAFNWKPFRVTWVNPRFFMGFVLIIFLFFCIIVCLYFFLSFGRYESIYKTNLILRLPQWKLRHCFLCYVVLFYYVPNQNKVFLFLFLSYTMHRLKQHNIMQKYIHKL
jgi:hypothetical protein